MSPCRNYSRIRGMQTPAVAHQRCLSFGKTQHATAETRRIWQSPNLPTATCLCLCAASPPFLLPLPLRNGHSSSSWPTFHAQRWTHHGRTLRWLTHLASLWSIVNKHQLQLCLTPVYYTHFINCASVLCMSFLVDFEV